MSREMTNYPFKTLGLELSFSGPKNAADINALAGDPRATEKAYMQIYAYHDRAPAVRKGVAEALEASTGNPRGREADLNKNGEQKKTKTGEPAFKFTETEDDYISRLIAEQVITQEDFEACARKVNEGLGDYAFNPGRVSKPDAVFYGIADQVLSKVESGKLSQEKAVQNLERQLGTPFESTVGEWNRDNVARYLELIDRKKKEELAALAGEGDEE